MKRVSIERYKTPTANYAGCIEGETDDGTQWIMFMDETGKPEVFWPTRTPDGGVLGMAVPLSLEANRRAIELRMAKMREILDHEPDPVAVVARLRAALRAPETMDAETMNKVWELRNEKIFGHQVSPEKPEA